MPATSPSRTFAPASYVERGLDEREARARLHRYGPNELPPPERPPLWRRIARELREPMAALLTAAAVVDGVVLGEVVDAAAIGVVVVLNATIALVQEGRASAALEALRAFETPGARVRRSGRVLDVAAREVVVGDVVLLEAGDRVPADVDLVVARGLEVDEALLTGESLPAIKDAHADRGPGVPVADRAWMAFSGTLVTRGSATGVVEATGQATGMGQIAQALAAPPPPTPLQRHLAESVSYTHLTLPTKA